jgi:hypothetical protein
MNKKLYSPLCLVLLLVNFLTASLSSAQSLKTTVPLLDLSAFVSPAKGWELAADVYADPDLTGNFSLSKGTGILVGQAGKTKSGSALNSIFQYGDIDIEMDYLVAKGARSGIYLQGRYKLQLADSWGIIQPKSGDNGGLEAGLNDTRHQGQAPRQNVSRAPGLWQHIKISFQAPRFDASGVKTENAKMLQVWLNGVLIHENVEMPGPASDAADSSEVPAGPLRFQGEQGSVAFKNIRYTSFDKPHPKISGLKYAVYQGNFPDEPDYKGLKAQAQGTSLVLGSGQVKLANEFILRYTGVLHIKEAGEYRFKLSVPGGKGTLKVNGIKTVDAKDFKGEGAAVLPAGDLPFEIFYTKNVDWAKAALGLTVSGPGIREYLLSDANVVTSEAIDPILVNATENKVLRSFTDLPGDIRVAHAAGVGSPLKLHYSYDLDNGMIVQVWRGDFLDVTPMWHERGDGSSRPAGSVQYLGSPAPAIFRLSNPGAAWSKDTTATGYQPKGYNLDPQGLPTFKYFIYGSLVRDASSVIAEGQGLRRVLTLDSIIPGAFMRLALGSKIEMVKKGLYRVDEHHYISIGAQTDEPLLRKSAGMEELIIPIRQKLTYSILF